MNQSIRKFFGLPPIVGDQVNGGLDFGVYGRGVVIEEPKGGFECYTVRGIVQIKNDLNRVIEKEEDFFIHKNKIRHE